jgi:hypothetical protein
MINEDRVKRKGDAVLCASPRIQLIRIMFYGWASSPSHIGQLPKPGPIPEPA